MPLVIAVSLLVSALFLSPLTAQAQDTYPTRPIRLIVPFAAGGPADVVARIVATGLPATLKQQIIVENRTGAGVLVGSDFVAKATPDGYTMLFATTPHTTASSMFKSMPYNSLKDFAPIGLIGSVPMVMVVPAALNVTDVKGFIALAKAKPGKLNFGSAGHGALDHLSAALFEARTGISASVVKYRGTAPAIQDLVAGRLDCIISTSSVMLPYIESGALRALAVTYPTRLPTLPNVPTMAEAGVEDFEMSSWYGLLFPAAVPSHIVERMQTALKNTIESKAIDERLRQLGAVIAKDSSSAYFAQYIAREQERWGGVLKSIGYEPE